MARRTTARMWASARALGAAAALSALGAAATAAPSAAGWTAVAPAAGSVSSAVQTELVEVFAEDGAITRVEVPVRPQVPVPAAEAAALAASPVTPLQDSGPSSNRLDLVIVGDGYTAAEQALFRQHAADKWAAIARTEPFASYAPFFNVWLVEVVSAESGVDNDPRPPTQRATALDAQFWCSGTERLLCVDQAKARAAASAAPGADQILVLANSTKYGGAGGAVATASGGSGAAGLITVHELGHSLGNLTDEYDYYYRAGLAEDSTQDVTIPAPYLLYAGAVQGEPPGVNVSAEPDAAQIVARKLKWWRWVGEPSPEGGVVGSYEGAGYYRYGMYRPSPDSMMHTLGTAKGGNPFNAPSREQFIRRFYAAVDPVDTASPAPGPLAAGDEVRLELLEPVHALEVRWSLDGVEVEAARGATTFAVTAEAAAAATELRAEVVDPTAMIRDPAARAVTAQTLTWSI